MPRYYVSGVVQIGVQAKNAQDAVEKAAKIAMGIERRYALVGVSLDNISTDDLPSVGLHDAGELDKAVPA